MKRGQTHDGSRFYLDYCDLKKDPSGKTVIELSCQDGKMFSDSVNCERDGMSPYCRFGECSSTPITCTDSDGLDEFTKGEITTEGVDQEVNQGRDSSPVSSKPRALQCESSKPPRSVKNHDRTPLYPNVQN